MNKQGRKQSVDTRFKPGQSGNPAGRPKGSKNKTTLMKEGMEADWLNFLMDDDMTSEYEEGERKRRWQMLMEKIYEDAMAGDSKARQLLLSEAHKDLRNFNNIQSKQGGGPRSVRISIKTKQPEKLIDGTVIDAETEPTAQHNDEEA